MNQTIQPRRLQSGRCWAIIAGAALTAFSVNAKPFKFLVIGDSLSAGVQSREISQVSQPWSYAALVAQRMRVDGELVEFPLPLIQGGWLGVDVILGGDALSRHTRVDPTVMSPNLAIAGNRVVDALELVAADATSIEEADDMADLMRYPNLGTQVEIAEQFAAYAGAKYAFCWLGANDVLTAATRYDNLVAGEDQMTPPDEFESAFRAVVDRLYVAGLDVIYGTIPDVTDIGYLFAPEDLRRILGADFGLPAGHFTTLQQVVDIWMGMDDGSRIADPDYVLDPVEIARIQARIEEFNRIIRRQTAPLYPSAQVVDTYQAFKEIVANPPEPLPGVVIRRNWLGGLFSLDGFHPSRTGHALLANVWIDAANAAWGLDIPPISDEELRRVVRGDPHVDKDGDLKVRGRLGAGQVEFAVWLFGGHSGDWVDVPPRR